MEQGKKMKQIYLVRHGQTVWNLQNKAQGWKDSPLSKLGVLQAEQAAMLLNEKEARIDAAFSSDLSRAVSTMKIIAPKNTPMFAMQALREMSFGDLDGKDKSVFSKLDWSVDYQKYHGESLDDALVRFYQGLRAIAEMEYENILVVAHSSVMSALLYVLEETGKSDFIWNEKIPNGGILHLEYDGEDFYARELWIYQAQ